MLELDNIMVCFSAGGGRFFPLGQALPILRSLNSRKEAYVY